MSSLCREQPFIQNHSYQGDTVIISYLRVPVIFGPGRLSSALDFVCLKIARAHLWEDYTHILTLLDACLKHGPPFQCFWTRSTLCGWPPVESQIKAKTLVKDGRRVKCCLKGTLIKSHLSWVTRRPSFPGTVPYFSSSSDFLWRKSCFIQYFFFPKLSFLGDHKSE